MSVKGFIAPIEYTQYNLHEKWDALINLRVAEPEKQYAASIFCDFLPKDAVSVGTLWKIEHAGVLALLKQLHPEPHLDMHGDSGTPVDYGHVCAHIMMNSLILYFAFMRSLS